MPTKSRMLSIALIAVVVASFALSPSASEQASAEQVPGFVTLPDGYSSGFVLLDDTKQWIDQSCRQQVEAEGARFIVTPWSTFGARPVATTQLRCDQIVELYNGITPDPDAAAFLTNSSNNSAGWVLVNSTRQWIDSECRQQLEVAGATFAITQWSIISNAPSTSNPRTCDQLESLIDDHQPTISVVITTVEVVGGFVLTDTTRQWIPQSCVDQLTAAGATFTPTPWTDFSNLVDNPDALSCDAIEALLDLGTDDCVTFTSDDRWATAAVQYRRLWEIETFDPVSGEIITTVDEVDENFGDRIEPPASDFLASWTDSTAVTADQGAIRASARLASDQSANAGTLSIDFFNDPTFDSRPPFGAFALNEGEGNSDSEATYATEFTSNGTCALNFSGFLSQNRDSWNLVSGLETARQSVTVQQLVDGSWVDLLNRAMPAYDDEGPITVQEDGDDWVLPVDDTITLEHGGQYRMQVYARTGVEGFPGQDFGQNAEITINLTWTLTEPGARA